jgi:hypothetical protein
MTTDLPFMPIGELLDEASPDPDYTDGDNPGRSS